MRNHLFIIGLVFCCIVFLLYGLITYWDLVIADFGIAVDKAVVIPDNHKVDELIAKNTPVRVEIVDERWGKTVIEDPVILFNIWNLLREPKTVPSKYLVNRNRINGYIYFYDGSKQFFSISDQFQLGDSVIENSETEELDVNKLYRILQYNLASQQNLIKMVETADAVYLYKANDFFDPESDRMLKLTGKIKQQFLPYIAKSHKVVDSNELNHFLLDGDSSPLFHIALSFKEGDSVRLVIISVLSDKYFNVMDMSYIDRNIIYFEGPLGDFCKEIFDTPFAMMEIGP